MVFDPSETFLYSADMWANKVWTHRKDPASGKLEMIGSVDAPKDGDHPRWVAMHPGGRYLYTLMEGGNTLAVYVIDERTGLPVWTGLSYPLIPPSKCSDSSVLVKFPSLTSQVCHQHPRCIARMLSSLPRAGNIFSPPHGQIRTL
jgi:hypothetical protein